ncbi:N-acetylglucosaminidase [Alkalihalobacterium bogoriense]|uniref:N-acetylglucosaminidase n=1 Tax=Alkalihalobacterium bogoriense TaxID=246272 RepID=UPI000A6065B6|nr:N-acetylglucosaminidase [Alkalihalobacterium bogoriense]
MVPNLSHSQVIYAYENESNQEFLNEEIVVEELLEEESFQVDEAMVEEESTTVQLASSEPRNADEWLQRAASQSTATERLEMYLSGFERYPNDARFIDGINSSARSLLMWATQQHQQQQFAVAIERYEALLPIQVLTEEIQREVQVKLKYAKANKRIPSANDMNTVARSQSTASERLAMYIDGFGLYPTDKRFSDGINTSARALLNWSASQHIEGQFAIAIDRYEYILASPSLSSSIKNETQSNLNYAKQGKRSPDMLHDFASRQSSASARLAAFITGYETYPADKRFEVGINTSAQALLVWSRQQHQQGQYNVAVGRYDYILAAPVLSNSIKKEAEVRRKFAQQRVKVPNADQFNTQAKNKSTASERLEMFIDGYYLYPSDNRFESGINTSARSLMNWTNTQLQQGHFDVAIGRYEFILSAPKLSSSLRQQAERNLADARAGRRSPDAIYDSAMKKTDLKERLSLLIEGYEFYPSDSRFVSGIETTASALLVSAVSQHQQRNYANAVESFELILTAPVLSNSLKQELEIRLSYAKRNVQIPSANQLHEIAGNQSTASDRLSSFSAGHILYPNDARFVNGINTSAQSLYTWARSQHQQGNFSTAADRYETILLAPSLSNDISMEVQVAFAFAKNREQVTANRLAELANQQNTASERLSFFIVGYNYFPDDSRFEEGIATSAQSLLNWVKTEHQNGRYGVAVERFEFILSAPVLPELLKREVELRLGYAKQRNRIPTVSQLQNIASNGPTASIRLELFTDAHLLYSSEQRFINGINESAQALLDWASQEHKKGNFDTAIGRYQFIINAIGVHNNIKNEARRLLDLAEKGYINDREIITYTQVSSTFANALSIQLSLNPPPQTDRYRNRTGFIHSSLANVVERGVVNTNGTRLRTSASTANNNNIAATVNSGTTVVIQGEVTGTTVGTSNKWYRVTYNNQTLYVHTSLVNVGRVAVLTTNGNVREQASNSSHNFGRIAKDRQVAIVREVTGTTVGTSNKWYEINFDTWRNAKTVDFEPFMDPNQNDIFQHLVLSSSVGVPSSQLNRILAGRGILDGKGQAFIDAGRQHSVNEVYLIAHALLETGNGNSELATGIDVGRNSNGNLVLATSSNRNNLSNVRTTYNMFGIGAFDSAAKEMGAIYAYNQGWFSPEAAIIGGAKFIGEDYIHNANKQNTLYKMRWNPARPGVKQYATDMEWATKQIPSIKNLYNQLDNPILHFDIPKYR